MPAWVRLWGTFKDDFLGFPELSKLVGPNGREGGWGYLAGGRSRLGEREAVILTLTPPGSQFSGSQLSDPWTISPDPMNRPVPHTLAQTPLHPSGKRTFVSTPH